MIGSPCTECISSAIAGWWEPLEVPYRAFPQEPPSENRSRNGRVIPLQVLGVSAPEKRALWRIAGGPAEGLPFVPICGMKGIFILVTSWKLKIESDGVGFADDSNDLPKAAPKLSTLHF